MTHLSLPRGARWLALVPLLGCGSPSPDGGAGSPASTASRSLTPATGPELLRDVNTQPSPFPRIDSDTVTLANGTTVMVLEDYLTGTELWRSDGTSAGTTLIRDLTPGLLTGVDGPSGLTAVGNAAYFFTARSILGKTGLWKTDGTAPGTLLLQEFEGTDDDHDERRGNIVALGSNVLFSFGNALWKTDGTPAGTRELKRFPPVVRFGYEDSGVIVGTALDDTLLFLGNDPATGMELWKTDGTPEGTVALKDLVPGPEFSQLWRFTRLGTSIFFAAGEYQQQLWKSDGTPEGTVVVYEFPEFTGSINELEAAGSTLFFSTYNELWKSDGTPQGTVEVRAFSNWRSYDITALGNRVFFSAKDDAGEELWTSDGTPGGTSRVADLWPGAGNSQVSNLFVWKGHLYFQATPRERVLGLYKTDGTPAGTVELKTWEGYTGEYAPGTLDPTSVADALVFRVEPLSGGTEMWRTDGTVAGTRILEPLKAGTTQTSQANLLNVGVLGGSVFFLASEDGKSLSLWKSDGTAAGVSRVATFANTETDLLAEPIPALRVGNQLFFMLEDSTHGAELWRTDGTAAGTTRVKDIVAGEQGSYAGNFTELGGALLFTAGDFSDMQLWKSDGTEAGTVRIPLSDPEIVLNEAHLFTRFGDQVVFAARNEQQQDVLWATDGTSGGTRALKAFAPGEGAESTWINQMVVANGVVYFSVSDFPGGPGDTTVRLWKSDGTGSGTVQLLPQTFLGLEQLAWVNGRLYFSAEDAAHGAELWVSDGTEAGSRRLVDLNPGAGSSYPSLFTKLGNNVFFIAADSAHGLEPWVTNGTEAGTFRLADVWPGVESGMRVLAEDRTFFITPLAIEDRGLVLFQAADPEHGAELWRTDGTVAGTSRWADVLPGPLSSDPSNFARVGDRLFFFAVDETHGREPWAVSLDYTLDVTAPALTCPADVTARASGTDGADVSYPAATVTDERGESVTPTYSQASGTRFSVGSTLVTVKAKDAAGNESQCTFQVKVEAATEQPQPEVPAEKDDSGCGCSTGLTPGAWPLWSLLALGWTLRRRKGGRGIAA